MEHRVQKILSNRGYCSRRRAEELIIAGRVKVNGEKITIGDKAKEDAEILVDNAPVKVKKKSIYLIFHKPKFCVTALTDERQRTIMEYVNIKERVFPIGRLDYTTTGLLLLTNDGDFANNVMHPRYEITKTYLATLDRPLTKSDKRALEKGVELDDGTTAPAKVFVQANQIEITIHEGKNRIVKRMMKELGYQVKELKRIAIGSLGLGELEVGSFRDLKEEEKELIFS